MMSCTAAAQASLHDFCAIMTHSTRDRFGGVVDFDTVGSADGTDVRLPPASNFERRSHSETLTSKSGI